MLDAARQPAPAVRRRRHVTHNAVDPHRDQAVLRCTSLWQLSLLGGKPVVTAQRVSHPQNEALRVQLAAVPPPCHLGMGPLQEQGISGRGSGDGWEHVTEHRLLVTREPPHGAWLSQLVSRERCELLPRSTERAVALRAPRRGRQDEGGTRRGHEPHEGHGIKLQRHAVYATPGATQDLHAPLRAKFAAGSKKRTGG